MFNKKERKNITKIINYNWKNVFVYLVSKVNDCVLTFQMKDQFQSKHINYEIMSH